MITYYVLQVASGPHANTGDTPAVLFSHVVALPAAADMQLHFDEEPAGAADRQPAVDHHVAVAAAQLGVPRAAEPVLCAAAVAFAAAFAAANRAWTAALALLARFRGPGRFLPEFRTRPSTP